MPKTLQERVDIVQEILGRSMFAGQPLAAGSLKNKVFEGGACTGYTFRLNNLSYRGIWLATIEDVKLKVDGQEVPRDDITLVLGTLSSTIDNLKNNSDVFWEVVTPCYINVNRVGGLSKGEHTVELNVTRRNDFGHSYGDGLDVEKYKADAIDLQSPMAITGTCVYTV